MKKSSAAVASADTQTTTISALDHLAETPSLTSNPYFDILDNIDGIVFVADIQSHKILYANKYTYNLLGNVTGRICWQALRGEKAEPCFLCSVNKENVPCESINYEIQNSVTRGWYDVHERSVNLPDGQTVRVHLATDITEKKQIDELLQKKEETYRTVADYTFDWECWLDEEQNLKYISPSCKRITGYRAEEFSADPALLGKIIHPEDKSRFLRHQEKIFLSPEYSHIEYRIINRDGKTKWISHYCQPVYGKDGSFWGRRSSNRDITDRKEVENKKKLNELRLSTLIRLYEKKELDTTELCNFVLESSLPITSSTIGFLGFLNNDESIVTIHAWSKSVMEECSIHKKPIDFNVHDAGIWGEAIRERKPFVVNDYSFDSALKKGTPPGHIQISRFMAVPLLSAHKVIAIAAVGNKEAPYTDDDADQLKLLLEGMWQILRRKQAEEETLKQSERIKHFASAVAHDLKNPAISVQGFARLLKNKYEHVLDARAVKYCEQIIKSSEQISSLAEDINIYISTRDTPWNFEVLELPDIWNTVKQEFMLQLQDRNIRWIEPQLEPVQIVANRIGLLRIFRNIVDNALKYGGERLSEITVGYETSEQYHILSIGNDGSNILHEEEQYIFQEFKRSIRNVEIPGSGLGLSIVKEIAKKHKGQSWLTAGKQGNPVFCVSIFVGLKETSSSE